MCIRDRLKPNWSKHHFRPKICNGGWALKTIALYLEMGASTIERNWSTIDSRWFGIKNRNERETDVPPPSPYLEVGVSTIEHNWSTIESTRFDLKIRNGGAAGGTFPNGFHVEREMANLQSEKWCRIGSSFETTRIPEFNVYTRRYEYLHIIAILVFARSKLQDTKFIQGMYPNWLPIH